MILILIKCCLSMLPKSILWFNILTCLSVHNIQLIYMEEYWIWYLILQIPILSFLPSSFSGHFVLFYPNLMHYFVQNLAVNNLAFNPHYINTCADDILMQVLVKIVCENNHQSNVDYCF